MEPLADADKEGPPVAQAAASALCVTPGGGRRGGGGVRVPGGVADAAGDHAPGVPAAGVGELGQEHAGDFRPADRAGGDVGAGLVPAAPGPEPVAGAGGDRAGGADLDG